jgi:hypothetical protein
VSGTVDGTIEPLLIGGDVWAPVYDHNVHEMCSFVTEVQSGWELCRAYGDIDAFG